MIEKQETIDDILEEMRNKGWEKCQLGWDENKALFLELADRIETSWKRYKAENEASALSAGGIVEAQRHKGNAAAMREALEFIKLASDDYEKYGNTKVGALDVIYEKACAALSAPPRNCDVGTAEEQAERYHATGEVYHTLTLTNALEWAQMPYESGGAA